MTDTAQLPDTQRWVRMRHETNGEADAPAIARRDAFLLVWEPKGWEVVEEVTEDGTPVPPPLDLDKATREELAAEAERRGVAVPAKATKADIVAALNQEVPAND